MDDQEEICDDCGEVMADGVCEQCEEENDED